MELILAAIAVLMGSGVTGWFCQRWPRLATGVGAIGAVTAAGLGLVPAWQVLSGESYPLSWTWPWSVPGGQITLELDPLAAWFLFPILIVPALAAVYATETLRTAVGRRVGPVVCLLNVLTAAMIVVVLASNGLLFLVAWEVAAVTGALLVLFEHEHQETQRSAWMTLLAAQLSAACLLVTFALLGEQTRGSALEGSLAFADLAAISRAPAAAGAVFILALLGCGVSAGLIPVHSWTLPAQASAPSHVSAVHSSVQYQMGVYAFLRILSFLGPPVAWWAWSLLIAGLFSGIVGVRLALNQSDLRKLLACGGIVNRSLVFLVIGLGLFGMNQDNPTLLVLGFTGALFHVWNQALNQSLLCLTTGVVGLQTGTTCIDRLGGQIKRLPWTAGAFLVGLLSICGLLPFNGFVSFFLILFTAFQEGTQRASVIAIPALLAVGGVVLIHGLSLIVFIRAFGQTFLGTPRTPQAAAPRQKVTWPLRFPVLLLALGCYTVGLLAPRILKLLEPVTTVCVRNMVSSQAFAKLQIEPGPLQHVVATTSLLLLSILGLMGFRWLLLRRKAVAKSVSVNFSVMVPAAGPTPTGIVSWHPTQEILTDLVPGVCIVNAPPDRLDLASSPQLPTDDPWRVWFYEPLFRACGAGLLKLRWLQGGHTNLYVLYVVLTLMTLMLWQLGWSS